MAQHDYIIANQSGAAFRADLNNALAAIVSQNSGAAEPSVTYAYMPWADTTTGLFKIRNAANSAWITLYQLDGEWSTIALEDGTAAAPSLYFKDSGTDTGVYSPGADQVAIATAGVQRVNFNGATEVAFNDGGADVDFRVEGDTKTKLLWVDAGNDAVGTDGEWRYYDADASNYVAFKAPATVSSNVTWTLPSADGAGGEALTTNGSGVLGFGGTTCKAWVNFNGTGTVAIRASYNVSSITDNGTGDYTVNFTTALADANFAVAVEATSPAGYNTNGTTTANLSSSSTQIAIVGIIGASNVAADSTQISAAIFR